MTSWDRRMGRDMLTRLRRRVTSRILRQQIHAASKLPELAEHRLRPLIRRAYERPIPLAAMTEQLQNLPWGPALAGDLTAALDVLLTGSREDRRAAAHLFVAALRAVSKRDLELSLALASNYTHAIPDPRAFRTLVTLHTRAGNLRRALGLLELIEPSDWTAAKREKLERRIAEEESARNPAGSLQSHVGYRSLLEDPSPAILLYGDLNMNKIDGSSVWLASVAEALTGLGFEVHFLLKHPPERMLLLEPLMKLPGLKLFEPLLFGVDYLRPARAVAALEAMDGTFSYSAVIIRGLAVCDLAASQKSLWGRVLPYLTDFYRIEKAGAEIPAEVHEAFSDFGSSFDRFLVQTPQIAALMQRELRVQPDRIIELPPLIPDHLTDRSRRRQPDGGPLRIVYAGKIAPLWGVLELISHAEALAADGVAVEVHVVGDKIHESSDQHPTFQEDALAALEGSPVVRWHKGLTRRECLDVMADADVGWCYRDPHMELHTLELSTKLIEHIGIGLPPIVTRNAINEALLGPDYPLFVGSPSELGLRLRQIAAGEHQLDLAAPRYQQVVERHTISSIRERLLRPALATSAPPAQRRRIVLAGHDLKFVGEFESHLKKCGHIVRRDEWEWGRPGDENRSHYLVQWADVVFCEWALANAVWYSQRLAPSKRLFIRLHLQEVRRAARAFPPKIDMDRVDGVVFVADDVRQQAARDFGWNDDKLITIPNFVNTEAFARPKLDGARHTLAIVGIAPRRKRLDLALDLLADLRRRDPAFRLIIKGHRPSDLPWLLTDPEERAYYGEQLARIDRDPLLKEGVSFEEFHPRLGSFYQRVGFVLSPSDFESFHYAIAEGAASGAIPVVWPWTGADHHYPADWVVDGLPAARDRILRLAAESDEAFVREGARCAVVIRERYGLETILPRLADFVLRQ